MNNIPEADRKLDDELRVMLARVNELREGLHSRRPGCACDEKHLCAHHAAVYKHLDQVRVNLHRAMDQLESEG